MADQKKKIPDVARTVTASGADRDNEYIATGNRVLAAGGKMNLTEVASLAGVQPLTVETGITASTTQTQGQQPLTKHVSIIATVANTDDVVTLMAAVTGLMAKVVNRGANRLQVFPASGDDIDGGSTDAAVTIAPGTSVTFHAVNGTSWYS